MSNAKTSRLSHWSAEPNQIPTAIQVNCSWLISVFLCAYHDSVFCNSVATWRRRSWVCSFSSELPWHMGINDAAYYKALARITTSIIQFWRWKEGRAFTSAWLYVLSSYEESVSGRVWRPQNAWKLSAAWCCWIKNKNPSTFWA